MDNYSILKELEDFLTYQNVENIKNEFIRLYYEEDQLHNCNSETGIFDIYNSETSKFDTISFENSRLAELLWKKTQDIKIKIDTILIKTNGSKNETSGFINYLNNTISSIRQNQVELFEKFPICNKPFLTIEKYLSDKYADVLMGTSTQLLVVPNPLFANFPIEKIKNLYSLLTQENPFIDAEEAEFVNAFTGNVSTGIKWLVKNEKDNNVISKPSLFYFIDQLVVTGYINNNKNTSFLRSFVLSYFRKENGEPFKSGSLGTSITDYRKGQDKMKPTEVARKKDIDSIISKL